MIVLGIDTAMAGCSAALRVDGRTLACEERLIGRGHAEALMPMIERVLLEAGVAYGGLDRVAVTIGPGTFTGIRVGLAAARGLALALDIPVVGIGTLDALAGAVRAGPGESVVAAIDARRSEVYLCSFGADADPLGDAIVVAVTECATAVPAGPLRLAGTGAALVRPVLVAAGHQILGEDGPQVPDARVVAGLGARRTPGPHPPRPLYVRAPDATLPA